jgi:hypothetical protein
MMACTSATPRTPHDGNDHAIASIHARKCASCHMPPEPQSRTRSEVVSARMRHRNRVRLTDEEWDAMTDHLAIPDGTAVRVAR